MNTVVKIEPKDVGSIPFQEASLDIWDKKYRLTAKDGSSIDKSMDDTYKRVARALADVEREDTREPWYEKFLWALRRGAIPAGRVTSNAGALEHKPATSTINCTVSGTIRDSMDDILKKVHEAGLTLKAGCGIGYRTFDAASARRIRIRRRRLHIGTAVLHGYLRQDVLHGVLGRRPPRRADGHVRRRPSRCHGVHPRQAREWQAPSVQPFPAHHRRVHAGRAREPRLEAGFPAVAEGVRDGQARSRRREQVRVARVGDPRCLRDQRGRPGRLQDLQDVCRRAACGT